MTAAAEDRPGFEGEGSYFECPLCDHLIKYLEPDQTPPQIAFDFAAREDEDPLQAAIRFRIEQVEAANEQLVLSHFETHHSIREFAVALGTARNALLDLQRDIQTVTLHVQHHAWASHLLEVTRRGLGG